MTQKAKVLICGDLVWDTHVARLQSNPGGYFQPHLQSQLTRCGGGAWYLHKVVKQAIEAAAKEAGRLKEKPLDVKTWAPQEIDPDEVGEKNGEIRGVAKGISVWEWFDGKEKPAKAVVDSKSNIKYKWREGEATPGAWRIKEFLGCQEAQWDLKGENILYPGIKDATGSPDVLVIDDLGLGFAHHEECWPDSLLKTKNSPHRIVIKGTPPFDNALWKRLLTPEWAANLTVVISAGALRDFGARLSRGFSWDQTIQEVKREFMADGICRPLGSCHRVVVLFGFSGAAVFSRAPRSPEEAQKPPDNLQFERFVFDPAHMEDIWPADLPGITFGLASVMTAAITAHLLHDWENSSHLMVSRGLEAARELHRLGGGHSEREFSLDPEGPTIFDRAFSSSSQETFWSAFPRELLDDPVLARKDSLPRLDDQTLLTDVLGLTSAFLTVAAQDIVRYGRESALKSVPRLECGKYFTVDREEIERLNSIRNLVTGYRISSQDRQPLSIAVFGAPGSGKSFAIKQLSESLFGKDRAELEFNLSQFENLSSLHEAFHEIRDKSVQGQIPLVFWDEFDSRRGETELGWLKEFLAPMQDAHFVANGKKHPFGKCIFIFAGGLSHTYAEFNALAKQREASKGPDFVSRLRGYVNIKGPNPAGDVGDDVHIIRRALLLRSLIEKHHKGIIDPVSKELVISPAVLDAFLHVGAGRAGEGSGYLHGSRSMEAIVSLSRLQGSRHFGPSELPASEVINLHASRDFLEIISAGNRFYLAPKDIEQLAEMLHENWRRGKEEEGYSFGEVRDDAPGHLTHPLCKPYRDLKETEKDYNRLPARRTVLRLESLGYRIIPIGRASGKHSDQLPEDKLRILARSEHRRWMREKLIRGCSYSEATRDELLRHRDICKFELLAEPEKKLDKDLVMAIIDFLKKKDLVLAGQPGEKTEPHNDR